MIIGIDFDNTIVCYDQVFHRVALEQGLIPGDLPVAKDAVRDYLRRIDREDEWTEMQGLVYGSRMADAQPFPGVEDFISHAAHRGLDVRIISHKTRQPFMGPPYDLHQSARDWLEARGYFDPARIGMERDHVFFELTKREKVQRIADCACDYFIDDLPEFLAEPGFPADTVRILFDPNNQYVEHDKFRRVRTWPEIEDVILAGQSGRK